MPGLSSMRFFLALVLLCLVSVLVRSADATVIEKTIRFSFTLQNTSGNVLEAGDFWAYGPVAETSHQRCLSLEASQEFELLVDEVGNQVMHFKVVRLPPFAVKIIRIKAILRLDAEGTPLSSNPDGFLAPTRFVEADSPLIMQQAARLKTNNALTTARRIQQWVAGSLQYAGFSGVERGALFAFEQRRGDCTEFSDLFVALARAAGIPARQVGGYVATDNLTLNPADFHDWAEFRHGSIWEIADPQKMVFADKSQDYIAFKIVNNIPTESIPVFSRFLVAGEGLQARMNF
jgi:hypothetical protein